MTLVCEHTTHPYRITSIQRLGAGLSVLYGVMWEHFASFIPSSTKTSFKQRVYAHQQLLADSFTLTFRNLGWTVPSPGTKGTLSSYPLCSKLFFFFFWIVICHSFLDVGLSFLECFKYTFITCFRLLLSSSQPLMEEQGGISCLSLFYQFSIFFACLFILILYLFLHLDKIFTS